MYNDSIIDYNHKILQEETTSPMDVMETSD